MRLRPVRLDDAAFIVWLRNLDHVRGKVGDSATDVAGQEAWLKKYFEREGDYYFIAETPGGTPLGTHGIYDVKGTSAEQGRQIMRPDVMAGVPTAVLATDLAFRILKLSELRGTSVSTNLSVHSLLRKSGFKQLGVMHAAVTMAAGQWIWFNFFSRRRTGSTSAIVWCRWPTWPGTRCGNGKKRRRPGTGRGLKPKPGTEP